jgi:hypothetical protein
MSDESIKDKIEAAAAAEAQKLAPELSTEDLNKVVAGASDVYLNLEGIKGESLDEKPKPPAE